MLCLLLGKLREEPSLRDGQMAVGSVPAEAQVPGDLCGTVLWEEECPLLCWELLGETNLGGPSSVVGALGWPQPIPSVSRCGRRWRCFRIHASKLESKFKTFKRVETCLNLEMTYAMYM